MGGLSMSPPKTYVRKGNVPAHRTQNSSLEDPNFKKTFVSTSMGTLPAVISNLEGQSMKDFACSWYKHCLAIVVVAPGQAIQVDKAIPWSSPKRQRNSFHPEK